MSEQEVIDRIDAYLSGRLDLEQTAALERELAAGGEVARLLGEELMLRDLLGTMPPDDAPEGLVSSIQAAMPLGEAPTLPATPEASRGRTVLDRIGLALGGASWSVRGPAMALGPAGNDSGSRAALGGLSATRYALGPLTGDLERRVADMSSRVRKPLWRRAAGLMFRKRR